MNSVRQLSSGSDLTDGLETGHPEVPPTPPPRVGAFDNESFVCDLEDPEDSQRKRDDDPPKDGNICDAVPDNGKEVGLEKLRCARDLFFVRKTQLKRILKAFLFVLYNVYLGFAVHTTWDASASWCEGVKFLTVVTSFAYAFAFHAYVVRPHLTKRISRLTALLPQKEEPGCRHASKVAWCGVVVGVAAFLAVDTRNNRYRLVSVGGLLLFVLFGFLFSKHRAQVCWRPLFWGLSLQFCTGCAVLRWSVGREVFACLGDKVKGLLEVTDRGSTFVFGYLVSGEMADGVANQPAVFAFKVLSVVIFFSFVVSLLYYWGAMQIAVAKVGWLLRVTVGTTACESMNAAGNIFLGMTEAPLLIRPFLPLMTLSELHAVMTGGFATIAGSVLAAYVNFGINASHLLTASVMAAPAALGYSKLVYPETEPSRTEQAEHLAMEKGQERSALEAATNGASAAISLVSNIAANLIAFVAFIALLDTLLAWFGSLVLFDQLSFQWLLSKLFIPVSLAMGVEWSDCEPVANLIGLKTVVNEFVAYKKLGEYRQQNLLSSRSEAIATFALCGFSNVSSIGIQMGALSAMAPNRKSDLSQIAVRAMITGTVVCFMNACVAGALLQD